MGGCLRIVARATVEGVLVLSAWLAVAGATLLGPPEEQVSLVWDAPAACPEDAVVRARIEQHVRASSGHPSQVSVRARVQAPEPPQTTWRLHIELGDRGEREVSAQSCEALADAAVLMVAISLEADAEAGLAPGDASLVPAPRSSPRIEPAPGEGGPSPATARARPSEPVAATPEPEVAQRSRPSVISGPRGWVPPRAVMGVRAGAHGVGLPDAGGGVGGQLGLRWGPLRIVATGMHWFRREHGVVEDVAAAYRLTTGGLEACPVLALGTMPAGFELLGCAQVEAGVIRGDGLGAEPSLTRRHIWVGVGGGVGGAFTPTPWLALGLRADVVAPLLRRTFSIGDAAAGRIGPVDLRGALFVEVRLPAARGARPKNSSRR